MGAAIPMRLVTQLPLSHVGIQLMQTSAKQRQTTQSEQLKQLSRCQEQVARHCARRRSGNHLVATHPGQHGACIRTPEATAEPMVNVEECIADVCALLGCQGVGKNFDRGLRQLTPNSKALCDHRYEAYAVIRASTSSVAIIQLKIFVLRSGCKRC